MAKKFNRLSHHAAIKDGVLVYENAPWFRGMLALCEDTPVIVTVERRKKSPSKEQWGYLWGVVYEEISKHTGHSPEDLHDIFKVKYLRRKRLWRGSEITTVGSASELTSNELAEFITNVVHEASELGIEVPEPDKLYQFK